MKRGTCIHFNGLGFVGAAYKEKCCAAGVNYFETFDGRLDGIMLRMPCVAFRELPADRRGTHIHPGKPTVRVEIDRKGNNVKPCPHRKEPTDEQIEQSRRDQDAAWQKITAALHVAAAWRVKGKPANHREEVIECPVCKGRLHLQQSAHNGHCSGKCETAGCVSWIE